MEILRSYTPHRIFQSAKIVFISTLLGMPLMTASGMAEVVRNVTNDYEFYHITLTVGSEDFRLTHPEEFFNPRWPESTSGECRIGQNGSFVIYVSKEVFPIAAPSCNSDWIKITMDGRGRDEEGILSKHELWKKLKSVKRGETEAVDVVIELNPYVEVASESPLKLEMTYCNAFFRTAWGSYINHTGPITQKL